MADTIVGALRVLRDHWPQLIGIFLLGWTGRMGFLWAASEASKTNATLAILILPLAPLSTIIAMVMMLRVVAETLPAFEHLFERLSPGERWRDHFTVAGQMLVPLLGVYASQDLIRQDSLIFREDTTAEEVMNNVVPTFERTLYAPGVWIFVLIFGVLALRKLISVTGLAEKSLAVAGFAAYLEALWLVTLVQAIAGQIRGLYEWIRDRAVIDAMLSSLDSLLTWLGSIGTAITNLFGWLGSAVASSIEIIVLPLSLLAVGSAVYSNELKGTAPIPTHEGVTRRLKRVPNPVKRYVGQLLEPVITPVASAWHSLARVLLAGLIPTVLFCLVFLLLNQLDNVVALALRGVVGPREMLWSYAVEPYMDMAGQLAFSVASVALVAAAVNALIAPRPDGESVFGETQEEPVASS